jgi:FkbM family methyltransferase
MASKKKGFTTFQILFMTVPLMAVGSMHFTSAPLITALWAAGRTGACPYSKALKVSPEIERQNKAVYEIMDGTSRGNPDESGLILWKTPQGDFWAPEMTPVPFLLSEQLVRFYGDGPRRVREGDVVLDCGANVGTYVWEALEAGASKIVAIEPSGQNVESLRRNFAEEIEAGRVVVYPKGVWHEETELKFYSYENSSLDSAVMGERWEAEQEPTVVTVPVTTIDKICDELGLERVDFIKMDVEGAELEALEGARKTIARDQPRMALATENLIEDQFELPAWIEREFPAYKNECGRCSSPERLEIRADVFHFYVD